MKEFTLLDCWMRGDGSKAIVEYPPMTCDMNILKIGGSYIGMVYNSENHTIIVLGKNAPSPIKKYVASHLPENAHYYRLCATDMDKLCRFYRKFSFSLKITETYGGGYNCIPKEGKHFYIRFCDEFTNLKLPAINKNDNISHLIISHMRLIGFGPSTYYVARYQNKKPNKRWTYPTVSLWNITFLSSKNEMVIDKLKVSEECEYMFY